MEPLPYTYWCRSCSVRVESPVARPPNSDMDCPGGTSHAWVRGTHALHYAFHEAAHAVVGARSKPALDAPLGIVLHQRDLARDLD